MHIYMYVSGHKWSTTHRVLKSHRSKMCVICNKEKTVSCRLYIYIYLVAKKTYNFPSWILPVHQCSMVIHALGHMITVHQMPKCMSYYGATGRLVIIGRTHCQSFWLHIYYAHLTSVGFEHSNLCQESLLTSFIYIYIYIYIYI